MTYKPVSSNTMHQADTEGKEQLYAMKVVEWVYCELAKTASRASLSVVAKYVLFCTVIFIVTKRVLMCNLV